MKLLTIPEVARLLQVRVPRAYQLARDGVVPVVRVGRQVRVDERALHKWITGGGCNLRNEYERVSHQQ